jgi:hypothetical protein
MACTDESGELSRRGSSRYIGTDMLHKTLPERRAFSLMTFYVYILYSKDKDRYSVGETSDLISRFE